MAASVVGVTDFIAGTSTVNFITLKGHNEPAALVVEDVSRDGVDGSAYRELQRRGERFDLVGVVDADSIAAARTIYDTVKGMQGTLVTVTDDYGLSIDRVMLHHVRREDLAPLVKAAGGLSTNKLALLTLRLTCERSL